LKFDSNIGGGVV